MVDCHPIGAYLCDNAVKNSLKKKCCWLNVEKNTAVAVEYSILTKCLGDFYSMVGFVQIEPNHGLKQQRFLEKTFIKVLLTFTCTIKLLFYNILLVPLVPKNYIFTECFYSIYLKSLITAKD